MNRRHFLLAGASVTLLAACAEDEATPTTGAGAGAAAAAPPPRHLMPLPVDAEPLTRELAKYPTCAYCGMDRAQAHQTRHLVHYDDNAVDATCSIHCAAVGLSLQIDRSPRTLYAANAAAAATPRPLMAAHKMTYVIGSSLPDPMSASSKLAFPSMDDALVAKSRHGGTLGTADDALAAAFADMPRSLPAIRARRAAQRAAAQQPQPAKK